MPRRLTLASTLLLTTMLSPAALAQSTQTPAGSPSTAAGQATPGEQPAESQADDAAIRSATPGADVATGAVPGQEVDVSTPGADAVGSDIVVIGRNVPNVVRATPEVVTLLSSADIARTGDGDIASALSRSTGLSVVGNGFVYVRGLGDRYSLALLNGLALPSPEPLRRVVPLDIFPTNVLSSALVQKSYSVNYPGEFGGGVINLTTSAIPEESFLSIGASIGADTITTSNLGYTYYGSDLDWSGFDDGARDPAPVFRRALAAGTPIVPGPTFSADDIGAVTASLLNAETTVVQQNNHIPGNLSADLSGGTSFDLGGVRVGLLASAGYDSGFRTRDSVQQTGASNVLARDFRYVRTEHRIVANGLLGLGLEFGENRMRFTNLYIRDTSKLARLGQGYSESAFGVPTGDAAFAGPADLLQQNTNWIERSLFNTQAVGEFKFGDLSVDLRGSYANSQREAPYERSFTYIYSDKVAGARPGLETVKDYVNFLTGSAAGSASVSFSDLNEDVYNAGADVAYRLPTARPITLSAGYAFLDTQRSSVRRDFSYFAQEPLPLGVVQQRPDYLVSDFNVYNYDIFLIETAGVAGAAAYDAGLRVHGAYLQADAELLDGVRLQAGVRFEDGDQSVDPNDILNLGGAGPATRINRSYWLPAATLTWNFAPDMQFRVAASKTVARPQFRELANQLYLDTESDRQFFGNRYLVDSQLYNAEARYEWYFGRDQRLSLAGFFKKIDKPIESIANVAGGFVLQTSFANAPEATLFGGEVELQKYFPLDRLSDAGFFASRRAVVIANYTYSNSELKVGEDDTVLLDTGGQAAFVQPAAARFFDGAPLTGQSDHLANLQLGLEDTGRLSQQTLLLTYASDRVTNRGAFTGGVQYPDVIEKPGLRLDFVWREGIAFAGKEVEVKFEARNITGRRFQEVQEGEILVQNNVYDVGTGFSLGLGLKF